MREKESPRKRPDLLSSPDMAQKYLAIAGVIILVLDQRGKITLVNRKGEEVLGWEPDELVGKSWFTTCLPKSVRKEVRGIFLDIMEGRLDIHEKEVNFVLTKDGRERLIAWHNTTLTDPEGNTIGTLSSGEDITEERRLDDELRASEERYHSFVRHFHGIAFQSTLDFVPIFIHGAVEEITGYTEQELTRGNPRWDQLIHPDDRWDVPTALKEVLSLPNLSIENEYRILPKGGGVKWVKEYIQFILNDRGGPTLVQGVVYDVTGRKKMEGALHESEEKYRLLVENVDEFVVVAQDGMPKFVNRKAAEISGYSREELLSRPFIEIIHPEDRQRVIDRFQKRMKGESLPYPFQFRAVDKRGSVRWVEAKAALINWEGRPATLNLVTDISDRKRAEERIEHLNRVLKSIRNINQIIVMEKDRTVLIEKACAILTEVTGYRMVWIGLIEGGHKRVIPAAHAGSEYGYLKKVTITWDDEPTGRGPTGRAIKTRRPCAFNDIADNSDYLPWRDEAVKRGYRSSLAAPLIQEDTIYGALTVYSDRMAFFDDEEVKLLEELARDIAFALSAIERDEERRRAEEELRINEEKYQTLVENLHDVIFRVDAQGRILYISPVVENVFGYRPEEVVGRSFSDFVYPEDLAGTTEVFYQSLREDVSSYELRMIDRQGAIHYVRVSARSFSEGGKPAGETGVLVDITERKRAEEVLRLSETKYRIVADNTYDWEFWGNPEGRFIYVSPSCERITGRRADEFMADPDLLLSIIHPDDKVRFENHRRRVKKERMPVEIEFRVAHIDGTYRWIDHICQPVFDNKNFLGIRGSNRDITDRKAMEESLRLTQFSVDIATDAVMWLRPDASYAYVNDAACRLLGYAREELLKMTAHDLNSAHPKESWPAHWDELVRKKSFTFEAALRAKDGRMVPVEIAANYLEYGEKAFNCAFVRDITDRKHAEEELRRSEAIANETGSIARIGGWEHDLIERRGRWTKALYDIAEIESGPPPGPDEHLDYYPPKDRALLVEAYRRAVETGETFDLELAVFTAKRRPIWGRVIGRPIMEGGVCVRMVGTFQDITDRKRAEEALRESEQRYRELVENIEDIVYVMDDKGRFRYLNKAMESLFGYSKNDLMTMSYMDFIEPSSRDRVQEIFKGQLAGEDVGTFELDFHDKDGRVKTIEARQNLVWDGGRVIEVHGLGRDITTRKRAEEALKESEEKLRNLFIGSRDVIYISTVEGRFVDINPAAEELFEYPREELLAINVRDLYSDPDERERFKASVAERGFVKDYEVAMRKRDGTIIDCFITATARRGPEGNIVGYQGIIRDITERKRTVEKLRTAAQEWRTTFDSIKDMISIQDTNCRIVRVNRAFAETLRMSPEEIIGKRCYELVHGTDAPPAFCPLRKIVETKKPVDEEFFEPNLGMHIQFSVSPIVDQRGDVIGSVHILKDITERKKVEGALKESEERYRTLVDNLPIGIYRNTPGEKGRFLFANSALMKMFGIGSPEDLGSIAPADLYQNPSERKVFSDNLLKEGSVSGVELRFKKVDGTPIWGSVTARVVYDDNGDPASFDCTLEDITERKRSEETLRESEERYRALFENATIGIFHSLPEGRLLRVNPALAAMIGYDSPGEMVSAIEDIGAQLYVDPKSRSEFLAQVIRAGGWSHYENQHKRKDGSIITVDLKIRPVYRPDGTVDYLEGFAEDITEKKKMEQQLLQAEKLSSLGGILSGVAHELNNPLTSIIGNAQLLMRKEITEDIREKLEIIQMESLRSSKIIQGLLAFARKHKPERKPVRINDVIQEAYRLREYDLRVNDVNMKLELADSIPVTHADPYQLQQVFINLINNAHDALIGVGGGSLIIRTRSRDDTIAIEFVDDGPGIPESIMKYIFDPFFTTKEVGKGTGLGLSVAYGIISEHGGKIDVESEAGGGATFIIELPVIRGTDEEKRPIDERVRKPEGVKSILVVEDEENLRNLISIVLSEEGYQVDPCPDGERAIELINNKEYDAILTDMKMPGISGKDLYTFVQKHYPDQANRILFITGDVLGKDTQHFLRITGNRCIEKPFVIERLLAVLSDIISG